MLGVNAPNQAPTHLLLDQPGSLGPLLAALEKVDEVALDTEADNMFHYKTRLCLLQFLVGGEVFLVDVLAPGLKLAPPESCPVDAGFPFSPDELVKRQPLASQVKTLSGMEYLARKGVLYFNLHTRAHTFYGEMRGQIYPAQP